MSTCPDCKNEFFQPFVCTTCGAEKLYDATLKAAQSELAALRTKLEGAERKLAEHMAQPCCQEWHTCERACLPRAESWKVAAEEAERKLADAHKLLEWAAAEVDHILKGGGKTYGDAIRAKMKEIK